MPPVTEVKLTFPKKSKLNRSKIHLPSPEKSKSRTMIKAATAADSWTAISKTKTASTAKTTQASTAQKAPSFTAGVMPMTGYVTR